MLLVLFDIYIIGWNIPSDIFSIFSVNLILFQILYYSKNISFTSSKFQDSALYVSNSVNIITQHYVGI